MVDGCVSVLCVWLFVMWPVVGFIDEKVAVTTGLPKSVK